MPVLLNKDKDVFISVIIPLLSINDYIIKENLPAHSKMTYHDFEVILLPNAKSVSDHSLLKKYSWLRIVPTGTITRPAQKRDIGAKIARGKILAFIDDDAYPTKNWLTNVVSVFEKNDVEAICGPGILPPHAGFWEQVFDELLITWLGSGGFAYRFKPEKKRYVDDYPSMNFLIKRDVFADLGGFDSNYWPGEDSKLCEDLIYKNKGKILYDPSVVIYHHRRADLLGFLKQHGNYGFHRGAFFAHGDRNSRRISYLIPTAFVIYLFFLVIYYLLSINYYLPSNIYRLSSIVYFPIVIYKLLLLFVFLQVLFHTRSLKIALTSAIVLFKMHIVYGVRFVQGFYTGIVKKEKIYT